MRTTREAVEVPQEGAVDTATSSDQDKRVRGTAAPKRTRRLVTASLLLVLMASTLLVGQSSPASAGTYANHPRLSCGYGSVSVSGPALNPYGNVRYRSAMYSGGRWYYGTWTAWQWSANQAGAVWDGGGPTTWQAANPWASWTRGLYRGYFYAVQVEIVYGDFGNGASMWATTSSGATSCKVL